MTKQELIDRLVSAVDAGAMPFQINKIINEYNVANYRPDGYKEIVKLYSCEAYNRSSVYLKLRKLDEWLGFEPVYTSIYNATVNKIKNHIDKIKQDEEQ